MKKIRLLVVDDSKTARDELVGLIGKQPGVEIVGAVSSAQEALQILEEDTVDALFLDIEMPEMSGLEMSNILSTWSEPPRVVFATAYHRYAVAAFEANAVDYILKPYQEDRIAQALDKIRHSINQGPVDQAVLQGLGKSLFEKGLVRKMTVRKKNSKDRIVMDPSDFDYFHAKLAEVFAYSAGQQYITNMTLKKLSESLADFSFAPCHKAYLVNLAKIEKIAPLFNSTYEISLKGGAKIPLSRGFAKPIRDKIGDW